MRIACRLVPLGPAGLVLLAAACTSSPKIPEWGGFRGNNGSGIANTTAAPADLDKEHGLVWRTEIPPGYSSPTVAAGRVFVTGVEENTLVTLCLDRWTGEVSWSRRLEFDGKRPGANSPAAPTPVTDGERVYVVFHHVGLIAYNLGGTELWRADLGPFNIPHGMATSPLVHGGILVQLVDQDTDAFLAAFDAATGKELWRTVRNGVAHSYSTPALYEPPGGDTQVIVSGSFQIAGYDLRSGEKIWWVNGAAWQTKAVPVIEGDLCVVNSFMPSPSEMGVPRFSGTYQELLDDRDTNEDGYINRDEWDDEMMQMVWFILDLDGDEKLGPADWEFALATGRAQGGLFGIRLGGVGDVTETHVQWFIDDRRGLPDIPSPLLLDGRVYMIKRGGIFTCLDSQTGEVLKRERIGDSDAYYASPIAAQDRIITVSQSGQLMVIRAADDWELLSHHQLGEDVWSTPAIAGDHVIVRSLEALYCFGKPN